MRVAAGWYLGAACGMMLCWQATSCLASDPGEESAISSAVEALDDEDFFARERASRLLREIGRPAIKALVAAANSNSLEVTCRAIEVLRDLSGEADFTVADAAAEALAELATSPTPSTAQRASSALTYFARARSEHALEELRRLGAVEMGSDPATGTILMGAGAGAGIAASDKLGRLQLGKDWQGGLEGLGLLKWVRIEQLSLRGLDLGDEALPHLRELTHLRLLELYGTRITPEGVAALQVALPNVKIDRRAGGLLGIGGIRQQNQCEITRVQEGSAAERAGLREGDVIVSFDGQQIGDFESLTALIAQHSGGDRVAVEFLRDGMKQQVEVVLGQWE
jgi:hypothetical protein